MKDAEVSSITSVQMSKMDTNKKCKSIFEGDSYIPKEKSHRYNDSYLKFGIHVYSAYGKE